MTDEDDFLSEAAKLLAKKSSRTKNLSKERRSEIGSKAITAFWKDKTPLERSEIIRNRWTKRKQQK